VDVTVGTSVILDLPGPPQRASVTNPEIANIQIVPPNQILVNGKAPGVTTLIAWVNDKQEYFDIVVTLNLSLLHHAIKQIAPREEIEVKAVQTSVVLSGTVSNPSLIGKAADLAKAFLPEKAAVVNLLQLSEPHQVLLKVEIAEVNRSALREIGLDFINLGTTVAVAVLGATHGGLLATTFNRKEDVVTVDQRVSAAVIHDPSRTRLLFRALEEKGFLKSLARPNLIAASGASASFLVGGEFPVPVPSGVGVGGGVLVTILFKPFGIRLDFTPTLNDFGSVNLKISPEVSDLDFTNAVTITGFQIPALRTRRANTIVDLKPGQSLAIGGLISSEDRKTLSKFPILGDIPVLGALFRSTNFIRNETDLVILVTPEIVKPLAAGQVPNLEEQMAPTTEEERAIRQIPLY
jgi:pilus assembly protein CpaC